MEFHAIQCTFHANHVITAGFRRSLQDLSEQSILQHRQNFHACTRSPLATHWAIQSRSESIFVNEPAPAQDVGRKRTSFPGVRCSAGAACARGDLGEQVPSLGGLGEPIAAEGPPGGGPWFPAQVARISRAAGVSLHVQKSNTKYPFTSTFSAPPTDTRQQNAHVSETQISWRQLFRRRNSMSVIPHITTGSGEHGTHLCNHDWMNSASMDRFHEEWCNLPAL